MIPFEIRVQHDNLGNAPHLLTASDAAHLEEGNFRRASGDVVCTVCGKLYYDHPLVIGALWLNRVCGDDLVHL